MDIKDLIKFPIKYDINGTHLFDAENKMVAQVRGWGYLQYQENPELKQDFIGKWIEEKLNSEAEIDLLKEEIGKLKKTLTKIVEAGDLWGSEGKQHHEAIYIARCALALTSFQK